MEDLLRHQTPVMMVPRIVIKDHEIGGVQVKAGDHATLLIGAANADADEFDDHHARSVIVRGVARHLGEAEEHRAENVPLRPWVADLKYDVVEIRPTEISGRAFELARPWMHMVPTDG